MRSESMSKARNRLVSVWGESYGQTKWAYYLQKYGVTAEDEVPERMMSEIMGRAER